MTNDGERIVVVAGLVGRPAPAPPVPTEEQPVVLAHPECPPDVLTEADFVGSTSGMISHVAASRPQKVVMITECSMSDNVSVEFPEIDFVRSCTMCPHMKKITLENTLASLQELKHEIFVEEEMRLKALRAVERMLEIGRKD